VPPQQLKPWEKTYTPVGGGVQRKPWEKTYTPIEGFEPPAPQSIEDAQAEVSEPLPPFVGPRPTVVRPIFREKPTSEEMIAQAKGLMKKHPNLYPDLNTAIGGVLESEERLDEERPGFFKRIGAAAARGVTPEAARLEELVVLGPLALTPSTLTTASNARLAEEAFGTRNTDQIRQMLGVEPLEAGLTIATRNLQEVREQRLEAMGWRVGPPQNASEIAADSLGGLTSFLIRLAAVRKVTPGGAFPKWAREPIVWEIENSLSGQGHPGEGAAMAFMLQGIGKLPTGTPLKVAAESTAFGGLQAIQGADPTSMLVGMMIPPAMRGVNTVKRRWERRVLEAKDMEEVARVMEEMEAFVRLEAERQGVSREFTFKQFVDSVESYEKTFTPLEHAERTARTERWKRRFDIKPAPRNEAPKKPEESAGFKKDRGAEPKPESFRLVDFVEPKRVDSMRQSLANALNPNLSESQRVQGAVEVFVPLKDRLSSNGPWSDVKNIRNSQDLEFLKKVANLADSFPQPGLESQAILRKNIKVAESKRIELTAEEQALIEASETEPEISRFEKSDPVKTQESNEFQHLVREGLGTLRDIKALLQAEGRQAPPAPPKVPKTDAKSVEKAQRNPEAPKQIELTRSKPRRFTEQEFARAYEEGRIPVAEGAKSESAVDQFEFHKARGVVVESTARNVPDADVRALEDAKVGEEVKGEFQLEAPSAELSAQRVAINDLVNRGLRTSSPREVKGATGREPHDLPTDRREA
jgi:hypothetical protein